MTRVEHDDDLPEMMALRDDRERAFVRNYLACSNQTLAAMEAGYSPTNKKAAAVTASNLIDRRRIKEAIAALGRHHMGSRGSAIALNALVEVAGDPTHPQRVKAAAKIWDWVNPPTLKVEHTHGDRRQVERIETFKRISLQLGVPIERMLGPNRIGREFDGFLREWDATWGHESDEARFERLCGLVAQYGERTAPMLLGDRLTAEQQAKLKQALADPRHELARLTAIEIEPVEAAPDEARRLPDGTYDVEGEVF